MLIKIALRNLWRNKRRSIITGAAIALGLGMLIFSSGGTDGMTNMMIENATSMAAGHVVVVGAGYQEEPEVEIVVPDSPAVAAKLAQALPDATVLQRVFLDGLLTSPSGAMGVSVTAIDPATEVRVNDVNEKIIEGEFLDDDPRSIVLGKTLAETLDVTLGDKVVLMSQGDGEVESRLFRVRGVLSYGIDEIDGFYALITLPAAQEMLGLGDDVNQISVHLDSARDTHDATAVAAAAVGSEAVEVLSWQEALPAVNEYVVAEKSEIYVMYFIIFVMVCLGIVNTVLMSVLERMREFGVMLSLGTTPGKLASLVLLEASFLGIIAAVAGVGVGLAFSYPLMVNGLDMSSLYGGSIEVSGFAMDLVIFSDVDPVKVAIYVVVVWLMTVAAAIYPAIKAATLKPVECLQHQ
jgi:putative ABC transport system permease protein